MTAAAATEASSTVTVDAVLGTVTTKVVVLVDLDLAEEAAAAESADASELAAAETTGSTELAEVTATGVVSIIGATVTVLFTCAIVWVVSSAYDLLELHVVNGQFCRSMSYLCNGSSLDAAITQGISDSYKLGICLSNSDSV